MGKRLIPLLILIPAFWGAAFQPAAAETAPSFDQGTLERLGLQCLGLLHEGRIAAVRQKFTAELREQMSEKQLAEILAALEDRLGPRQGVEQVQFVAGKELARVVIVENYQKSALAAAFVFNAQQEIGGLWFHPRALSSKPAANNVLIEEDRLVGRDGRLKGRLTRPRGVESPWLVILVPGSGPQDQDETVGAARNKPFRDLAWGLAERGLAVLRFNKRFFQWPEFAAAELNIETEILDDLESIIQQAAGETPPFRGLVLAGHSFGGMILPAAAQKNGGRLAGMVLLAASPQNIEDIIYQQMEEYSRTLADEEQRRQFLADQAAMLAAVKGLRAESRAGPEQMYFGLPAAYWISLHQLELGRRWAGLKLPLLILQGGADFQIKADRDFRLFEKIFQGRPEVRFKLYENLNHVFMPAGDRLDPTDYDAPNQVAPEVLDDMASWIQSLD